MTIVQDITLRDVSLHWIAVLKQFRRELPVTEYRPFIREIFAAFLLLRWLDVQDAEREAMALFEDRSFRPTVPEPLRWRDWVDLADSHEVFDRIRELARYADRVRREASHPTSAYLHALADPLGRLLRVSAIQLMELIRSLRDLPFETQSERRALLDLFDQVIADSSDPQDGQFASPIGVARLVAAIANPHIGEQVYDPCFGTGNLLVTAWQQAERNKAEKRRAGSLLEIAGIEINASTFLIGLTRMLLAGVDSPRLEHGNSLEREILSNPMRHGFDVVLANPPIGVRTAHEKWRFQHFPILTGDGLGLFIQHALSQLKPSGRAVVAIPEGFLFKGGKERELRRELITKHQIEAVVKLPAGAFLPYTGVRGCLLVLRKQRDDGHVTMMDASPFFESNNGRKAAVLSIQAANMVAEILRRSSAREIEGGRKLPSIGGMEEMPGEKIDIWRVSIDELAGMKWDLTPRRTEGENVEGLLSSIRNAVGSVGEVVPLSSVVQVFPGRTIGSRDLVGKPTTGAPIPYVRIRDITNGAVGAATSWISPTAANIERRWMLAPGDVLVSRSGTIGKAAIVRNGAVGSIAADGLYVLRTDPTRIDAGFLLAYLSSPSCKSWMLAQARGAVIQHLYRPALDSLPVPLPPLQLQARAAAQFRDFGTDVLTFLAEATGGQESGRLAEWLTLLASTIPASVDESDDGSKFVRIELAVNVALATEPWMDEEVLRSPNMRWLVPLRNSFLRLQGIADIPIGPSLLSILQDAERDASVAAGLTTGHLPVESQARSIAEALRRWIRVEIEKLKQQSHLRFTTGTAELKAGSYAEISIQAFNDGALPLRSLTIESEPNWGGARFDFLQEQNSKSFTLRGDAPKFSGTFSVNLQWSATTLDGRKVSGTIELPINVIEASTEATLESKELGGSPYITGSPLEPSRGNEVFFGRKELIERISRQIIANGNVVLLEGNRRAGKTSILKHIEGASAIPGWLSVYASLQGAEGAEHAVGVPTVEVFRLMARTIATAIARLNVNVPLPNGAVLPSGSAPLGVARACREGIGAEAPYSDLREYLEIILSVLEKLGLGLVLMLDEFDKLQEGIDSGVTSPQVPENIRNLIQTYPKFSAILTGSRRLQRLREEYWSALYGLGTRLAVTALDKTSARHVVLEPVKGKLAYSDEAVERVIEVTACQPYLIQCLCSRVFDFAAETRARSVTISVVDDAASALVKDNEHFASLWDYAGQGPKTGQLRRQLILLACAQHFKNRTDLNYGSLNELLLQHHIEVSAESIEIDLSHLRELELIELVGTIGDGRYQLAIPLMGQWIEKHQDAALVYSRARLEAEEEND